MDMSVADVAKMLQVSQKTIYRWLGKGRIPAYKLNDQYRFDRTELLEWAVAQKLSSPLMPVGAAEGSAEPSESLVSAKPTLQASLARAVERGGVLYRIGGSNRSAVLFEIAQLLKLPNGTDRQKVYNHLDLREQLGSTAIGGGYAIPHSRQVLLPTLVESTVTICFLEKPIEYMALDGQPVHTLFVMVSQSLRDHVALLPRIVFSLRDEAFRSALQQQASRDELYAHLHRIEAALSQPSAAARE